MPAWKSLTNIWENIRQIDLKPLQEDAVRPVRIAIAGFSGSGERQALAERLLHSASPEDALDLAPLEVLELPRLTPAEEPAHQLPTAGQAASLAGTRPDYSLQPDLVICFLPSAQWNPQTSLRLQQSIARKWGGAGRGALVILSPDPQVSGAAPAPAPWPDTRQGRVLQGSVADEAFIQRQFIPAVINLLPDRLTSLARHYPFFRLAVANHLINDTCLTNVTYAVSTGLAEVVPILDIPLTVADMVVLTKNQAFLAYKLGLSLGFSTRWRDYLAEFGSVLGSGFVWRQMARTLVGLIPVWGILPKVGIAYAGTYVIGHTILQWYKTGRHLSRQQIQALYRQAFERGKALARKRIKLPRRKPQAALAPTATLQSPSRLRLGWPRQHPCPACGKRNPHSARFCQQCGQPLAEEMPGAPPN